MSIMHEDILNAGWKILGVSNCEADYRSVVGRAYYSTYHFACEFHKKLNAPGREPPDDVYGVHERLIYRLNNPTTNDENQKELSKQLGSWLKINKTSRVMADYNLHAIVTKVGAELAIQNASKALKIKI